MNAPVIRTTADYVLGYTNGDHVLIPGGEVIYQGGRILFVGRGWRGHVDETIECGNALVMPGFVDLDALSDIDHAILDSWSTPELGLGHQWSAEYFDSTRRDVFDADERASIREYALAQLIRHGVTTFMPIAAETHSSWAESYEDMVEMAEIAARLGIRGYLGPAYRSGVNVVADGKRAVRFEESCGLRGFEDATRFLAYARELGNDLVHGALLPCRIETLSIELMKLTAEVAVQESVPVRLHCLQSETEVQFLSDRYGKRPVELLAESGLLQTKLLIPHGIHLGSYSRGVAGDVEDIGLLARSGVTVVHCPMTSIRYGAMLESFDSYRAQGISIALGTDSFPPDLIRGIDYGTNLAKWADGKLSAGSTADYVRAATIAGADALGRRDLGRLEAGASADFIVADLGEFAMGVRDDPLRTLTMNGSGRDILRSVIAGRTVMSEGVVLGVDETALARRAQQLFEKMREGYSERDFQGRSADELFPPTFPEVTPA
ncbi:MULTISPECIES: chlorohydrolase family protein [Rhodococcus]|uniref:chlorohydrolase family protein n=1 Tax=Rhodococcus globerulus TaxID=33008 RepID=UPI001FD556C5|nr:chlorohydrolase family protein [Rhodococcus globerulus]